MPEHLINDFCFVTGARVYRKGQAESFNSAVIDSRLVERGGAFFALAGEKTHGLRFTADAIKKGAALIISDKPAESDNHKICLLLHENPLLALQTYAAWYRKKYAGLVIGVTGSFGKTSTKDFLGVVLKGCGYVSEGNLNNTIGLPLCLLRLSETHDFAVFEAGISKPGEMSLLADILRPNIAVVTGVGCSHREFFPERGDLVAEKLSLTKYMNNSDILFCPEGLYGEFGLPESYAGRFQPLPEELSPAFADRGCFREFCRDVNSFCAVFGFGPMQSLLRALFVADKLNFLRSDFCSRLKDFRLSSLRMEKREIHGRNFILDCYNACPESMRSFLKSVLREKKPVVVLGDMLELGKDSLIEHQRILELINPELVHSVFVLGNHFSCCAADDDFSFVQVVESKEELKLCLRNSGAKTFAFKASRGFSLETVAEDLLREGF